MIFQYYFRVITTFSFKGRARRAEYWWFIVCNAMVTVALNFLSIGTDLVIEVPADNVTGLPAERILILSMVYSICVLVQTIAVQARRMHDSNKSGWWLLLFGAGWFVGEALRGFYDLAGIAVIALTFIAFIFFFVQPGTEGANKYGPDPKAPADA